MRKLSAIVIGAGDRGITYSNYALDFPDKLEIVSVADPKKFARESLQKNHGISHEKTFSDWKDAAGQNKFADIAIITTPDALHRDPAVSFANKGYHILLEKPMAVTEKDCKDIIDACKRNHVMLSVGHVLRYFPPMRKIKEIIKSGQIGEVVNIQHLENVGYWHFAHSFVRGNWRKEAESTFSLLAKCCHDVDLITWWMGDKRCLKVSSFGSLNHFKRKNKPVGAASKCLDCNVEDTCPYSAKRLYLGRINNCNAGWPVSVICNSKPTVESVTEALRNGPYGRCVYECDNDVCDNQIVNMEFEGGSTANLTMIAFTEGISSRRVSIFGTKGEVTYTGGNQVSLYDFVTRKREVFSNLPGPPQGTRLNAHSGADFFLFDTFIKAVLTNDPSLIQTKPDEILKSHLLVFEAERARRANIVVDLNHLSW